MEFPITTSTKAKQSLVGIELVRFLANEGDRIFTTDRARKLAPRIGLKDAYLVEALYTSVGTTGSCCFADDSTRFLP